MPQTASASTIDGAIPVPGRVLLTASIACYFIAGASTWVHPIIVNGLVQAADFSTTGAGYIVAIEMAMMCIASLFIAARVDRINLRATALMGLAVVAAGHSLSVFCTPLGEIATGFARALAGAGGGMMLGLPAAALVATARPDRNYAIMTGTALFLGATMLAITPLFDRISHSSGIFWLLTLCAVLSAPLVAMLPGRVAAARPRELAQFSGSKTLKLAGIILAVLAFGSPAVAVWVNIRLIANTTSISPAILPILLSLAVFASLAGSLMAIALGTRLGRLLPMLGMLLVQGVGVVVLTHTDSGTIFTIGAAIEKAGAFFLLPYFLGAAAALEGRGGHAAAVSMAWMLCGVTGPLIGGIVVASAGGAALGWLALVANLVAAALLFFSIDGGRPKAGAAACH